VVVSRGAGWNVPALGFAEIWQLSEIGRGREREATEAKREIERKSHIESDWERKTERERARERERKRERTKQTTDRFSPRSGVPRRERHAPQLGEAQREREFFIDNQLVQIRLNTEVVLADRPCAMGV